jgi:hypothetical protein
MVKNVTIKKYVRKVGTADYRKRVAPEFSPAHILCTFYHFSQKFLYQERHVRYKPTLYRPGTKRNGKSGKEKLLVSAICWKTQVV